jgi:hypothetical protein
VEISAPVAKWRIGPHRDTLARLPSIANALNHLSAALTSMPTTLADNTRKLMQKVLNYELET